MIDADRIIETQLDSDSPTTFDCGEGVATQLNPVRLVPVLSGPDRVLSLNGSWQAEAWPFSAHEEARLYGPECDDSDWAVVEQPGIVFYGEPEQKPAEVDNWNRVTLAHIDPDDGAVIRRQIEVPLGWVGKRIYLRFGAIYPAGIVYCNGQRLGEQMSGLTPIEWDVSELVQPGETALIAVRLLRRHPFVQLDMPRHAIEFTGLAQDAFLHVVEPVHLDDYHLISDLHDDLSSASLKGHVVIANKDDVAHDGLLTICVQDPEGTIVASESWDVHLAAGCKSSEAVDLALEDIEPWNDEFPTLYQVTLAFADAAGQRQTHAYQTGFRKFELSPTGARLNGQPVKFRGVNHLTYHPEYGMHTPKPWLRQCLTLMKRANVNAIRTHFLAPPALAELCDELGLYLLQELPIDWGTNYIHKPEWVGPALMRLEGGVRRDRHHPSLMVWSVGNENMPESQAVAEAGWHHLRLYDRFVKTLDPSRPTMFPPPGPANKIKGILEVRVGDVADIHYSFEHIRRFNETDEVENPHSWEADMETTTRQEALARGWSGVWFSSEYGISNFIPDLLHAPYASIITDTEEDPLSGENTLEVFYRRLAREWGYMRDDPTCLGGAYFPWLCAGTGDNPWGWVRFGEDADWGMVTADLLPKPQFWAMRVLFAPVQFPDRVVWHEGDECISFDLKNGYNQIDLAECTLRTMMTGGGSYMAMMRDWQDVPISGAPGETVTVTIPLWNEATRRALASGSPTPCRCIFLDPSGFRPVTADVMIVPEQIADERNKTMPIGPDAEL